MRSKNDYGLQDDPCGVDDRGIRGLGAAYLGPGRLPGRDRADGQEALYVAHHERPDLVILDLMMPK